VTPRQRVVVAGVSTRAAAESAARAGYTVTAIDAFGDLDQHNAVNSVSLGRDFSADAAARVAAGIEYDAIVYLANFENHPKAVRVLAAGGRLWGNSAEALGRARHPAIVGEALKQKGFLVPEVRMKPDLARADDAGRRWLVKPLASGGGQRIHAWTPGETPRRHSYRQEFFEGLPGSVLFAASSGRVVPLAVSRQLVGEPAFGAGGFQYCGNILTPAGDGTAFSQDEKLASEAIRLAEAVATEFQLVGVNGIDFIARDGVPYAIEINPRWCASMELIELAHGVSVFEVHAAACSRQVLPAFDLRVARRNMGAAGKAVVYARRHTTVGDTREWLDRPEHVRDVPHPGEEIPSGHPICTVFAMERDTTSCHRALVERASRVYEAIDAWGRSGPRIG
jgi:predicted ATP-grasp superfamily ATP-dependent carboligase